MESTNGSNNNNSAKEVSSSNVNNILTLSPTYQIDSLEEGEVRYLWIGHGDDPSSTPPARRRVPNCCAICLAPYEVNETVVWSCGQSQINHNHNSHITTSINRCNHAFHHDCMIDWLIKVQNGTPCPCCRQEFTDLPILPRRQKLNTTSTTPRRRDNLRNFDPGVLSFR